MVNSCPQVDRFPLNIHTGLGPGVASNCLGLVENLTGRPHQEDSRPGLPTQSLHHYSSHDITRQWSVGWIVVSGVDSGQWDG